MNIVNIMNVLWIGKEVIAEYEDKINSFTAKYVSSPIMGYVVFGALMLLAVLFIKATANK
ncbi:MAG: hypothetical protein IJI43_01710 [Bacilli bacterium]|nr:hypothetical protein [Bacilli bacterium]